ncbi:3-deoxy-8-phosphooctulonate synthase [Methylocystis echinoides]|jgi:2-dehydro-3-deoxyphosphooctonate aldolase (KDO 8-P synthase)|uniref:3-deoxy-8-phosphooctulonate synthase n=1 Tax=Methylocystis echinoides TaxID=29468 RepID=UPI00342208BC
MQRHVTVGNIVLGNDLPLTLIAGPCQLESRDHAFECAAALVEMAAAAGVGLVYKTSFDKANRTSARAPRGLGLEKALPVFADVKARFNIPLLTDVHCEAQCKPVAEVVDIVQIPAFLSRQTDLLLAAGATGAAVNIKKGQFMAPWDIGHAAEKVASVGNQRILLTERGASFGYNTLVVDMRGLPIMAQTGYPIIFDATHSVQQPGGQGSASGGDRRMAPVLARAAVAIGVAGVFVETHPDPDHAPSDGPSMLPLRAMPELIETLLAFDEITKRRLAPI